MILIVAEHASGSLSKVSLEMVSAARASGHAGPVTMLVLGSGVGPVAAEAARVAEQVLVFDSPEAAELSAARTAAAAADIAGQGGATLVLTSGSRFGREFAPRLAVRLSAPYLEDVISLEGALGQLRGRRYSHLARVTETVSAEGSVIVASVKPGAFDPAPADQSGQEYDIELQLPESRVQITGRVSEDTGRVALAEANVVVTGGRGVGSAEKFGELVEGLADAMGAGVGATRAVVDAGWRPYGEQVGQTGKTVAPGAYIALGVSGAVQHMSGMGKSRYIVAVNKDAEAPIFKVADYGIVGDVNEIVPALIEAAKG